MVKPRDKGARGEREGAKYLRSLGFAAERAARNGVDEGEDIIWRGNEHVSIEVKRNEKMRDHGALMDAAVAQAQERGDVWCVLWRVNRGKWHLTFNAGAPGVRVTVCGDARIQKVMLWLAERGRQRGVRWDWPRMRGDQ